MSTSSIPTFKAALQSALLALTGTGQSLDGVQVAYGSPMPNPRAEIIMLGDVTGNQAPVLLGRQRRDEDYDLDVYVRVQRTTTDQKAVTERAFAIAAVVESTLRTDPTLTSTVREAKVTSEGVQEFASDDGTVRFAVVDMTVNVINRI